MRKWLSFFIVLLTTFAAGISLADGDGKMLYGKCKSCHGAEGQGNPSMAGAFKVGPDILALNDGKVADCVKTTTEGKNKMPAFGEKMAAAEIKAVCDYIKTLKQ